MPCMLVLRCQAMLLRRCADVAAGLGYLHSRNVCHGDLKLENVLLRTGARGAALMDCSLESFRKAWQPAVRLALHSSTLLVTISAARQ